MSTDANTTEAGDGVLNTHTATSNPHLDVSSTDAVVPEVDPDTPITHTSHTITPDVHNISKNRKGADKRCEAVSTTRTLSVIERPLTTA